MIAIRLIARGVKRYRPEVLRRGVPVERPCRAVMLSQKSALRCVLYLEPVVVRNDLSKDVRSVEGARGGEIGKGSQLKTPPHPRRIDGRMLNGYLVRLSRHIISRCRDRKHAGARVLRVAISTGLLVGGPCHAGGRPA